MEFTINTNSTNQITCTINIPKSNIDEEKYNRFIHTLIDSNFLIRITNRTGLKWQEPYLKIEYAKEANFNGLDTILVDYNRGYRAISSATHEAFHLMLRQISWTENSTVKEMIKRYPELENSSSNGIAYKMEQMFAYLLQNEIYQEISKDLNFDASKDYWDMDFIIESFVPYEFNSSFLEQLALAIIKVWNSPSRSKDIFELINEVSNILTEV